MAAVITEDLGSKELRKLRGRDLDGFYNNLSRRGPSPTSVRRYHAVLSASLNQAVRWGLLEHSPAAQATPPGLDRNEAPTPDPETIKLLIEAAQLQDPEFATLLFVAATTGCRRGELCGLQWSERGLGDWFAHRQKVRFGSARSGGGADDEDRADPQDGTRRGHNRRPRHAAGASDVAVRSGWRDPGSRRLRLVARGRLQRPAPSSSHRHAVHRAPVTGRNRQDEIPRSETFRRHGDARRRSRRPNRSRTPWALSSDLDPADLCARDGGNRPTGCGHRREEPHADLGVVMNGAHHTRCSVQAIRVPGKSGGRRFG